ncbi:MAG: DNA translocase FtsK 4TM domain-containing protein [Methylobacteriaceae bacterium]|nr:DNA translocase FtsK 4TM domain-containing protein [Methylobacteriaceae bacterium]
MRTTTTTQTLVDRIPEALVDFLKRRAAELTGLALISVCVAAGLALVTWSSRDPSLNHAVDGPVRNLLGAPGAIVSDVVMQMMGVAAFALLTPPALWGWRLLTHRSLGRVGLRVTLLLVGALAAAGVASLLPATDRWPLPTGLGGVVGDAMLALPRRLFGEGAGFIVCGFALAGVAILALTGASGFGLAERAANEDEDDEEDEPAPTRKRAAAQEQDDADGEPGVALITLGALIHGALVAKAALTRRFGALFARAARAPAEARALWLDPKARDDLALPPERPARPRGEPQPRLEPAFDPEDYAPPGRAIAPAPRPRSDYDDFDVPDLAPAATAQFAPVQAAPAQAAPAQPAPVAAPHRASTPARRAARAAAPQAYEMPALTMLAEPKRQASRISQDALEQNARLLEGVLDDFGVKGEIMKVHPGPVVTLYELEPAPGVKSSRVIGLADDIARSMSAISARVAVVQGRNAIGIELPNARRETVYLRELLASGDFADTKHKLAIALGKTIGGEPVLVDLAKMPHLLVAGTTGSGKSVAINTMILSLLYRLKPAECRLIMVDPKMLELSVYDGIPHLLTPVVTDPKKAVVALKWAVREMEDRYRKMSKLGVRNIDGFNARVAEAQAKGETITREVQTGFDRETGEPIYDYEEMELSKLPYIVVIVDEMADLMMVAGKDIEGAIQRLAQMARAAGIHLIMATQRPSVDVITGTIKANFPTRISFQVTSKIDSRTILGEQGAEQLLGQGDMLYMAGGGRISRVHGPFVSDAEVEKVVAHLKAQGQPDYLDAITEDDGPSDEEDDAPGPVGSMDAEEGGDLYDRAVNIVLRDKRVSTSYIQRRLSVGYNKAASLIERMEKEGVVSPPSHSGKREILVGGGVDRGAFDPDGDD